MKKSENNLITKSNIIENIQLSHFIIAIDFFTLVLLTSIFFFSYQMTFQLKQMNNIRKKFNFFNFAQQNVILFLFIPI